DPNAKDPVDQTSSRVQAVACFFPPTDFLNYGEENRNALTFEMLKPFWGAFGAKSREKADLDEAARAASPIYSVSKETPPTLIIHGDADTLVPIQQSRLYMNRLESAGVPHRLVVREGKGHGWPSLGEDISVLAQWIDEHCPAK
ncbi:MAG TPA: prolyl oligopeptidase family serine peptidase, partial [Armatimonadota bacterium]|nr:prolyl oligopeptidase family serine peptidase [Armatimonadota bacterium]